MYQREETNEKFRQFAKDIQVDWETVKTKIRADKEREIAASSQWDNWTWYVYLLSLNTIRTNNLTQQDQRVCLKFDRSSNFASFPSLILIVRC